MKKKRPLVDESAQDEAMADEQGENFHSPVKRSRTLLPIDISQSFIDGQQLCKYLIDRFHSFNIVVNVIKIVSKRLHLVFEVNGLLLR